jgi:hypothetical protein
MKTLKYIVMIPVMVIGMFMTSCEDTAENPAFPDDAIPRIFGWIEGGKYFLDISDELVLDMKVSPADDATYKWFIDDVLVSEERVLHHTFTEIKTHALRFEVTRNGVTNSRQGQAIVTKPFVPKDYNKKVVGVMTRDGSLATINLQNITHLVIESAIVDQNLAASSYVDTVFNSMNIELIVKTAHNEGVYVILGVSGQLSNINGGGNWGDYGFYNVVKDADHRTKAIDTFLKFAKDNDFDGVDIYLNNVWEGPGSIKPEFTKPFYEEIAAKLPEGPSGEFFFTASAGGGWLTSEFNIVVQIPEIDWVHLHPFRYGEPSITADAPYWAFTDLATTWINFGMPKEKIVNGIPGFGLHYFYPDDGTVVGWGNMWMYTSYDSYKSILDRDAEAHTKNHITVDDGIFYDGHPAVTDKANYVKTAELGGVMVWGIENDTQDQSKSIVKAIKTTLGNP